MTENEHSGFTFEEIPLRPELSSGEPVVLAAASPEPDFPVTRLADHSADGGNTVLVPPVTAEPEAAETAEQEANSEEDTLITAAAAMAIEDNTVLQSPEPAAVPHKDPFEPELEDEEELEPSEEETAKWRMPGILKFLIWLVVTLGVGLGMAYFGWICAGDMFALSKPDREVEITIEEDDTLNDVIDMLVDAELVEYEWLFRIYCMLSNAKEKYSVGTFTLNNLYDYNALVKGLQAYSGSRETTRLKIPEGCTSAEVFALLEEAGVCSVARLEYAAANHQFEYEFLQDVPYGDSRRLEGYLYPDTYEFYIDDAPERVLSKLISNFSNKFDQKLRLQIDTLNETLAKKMQENGFTPDEIEAAKLDLHDIVIVASLIEAETGRAAERTALASMIYNRLASKTYPLLEIDAALQYGLSKWDAALDAVDRGSDNPYNTSRYPGLPVGPISNPTVESIRAALSPVESANYFYARSHTGYLYFFETYYEHQEFLKELEESD